MAPSAQVRRGCGQASPGSPLSGNPTLGSHMTACRLQLVPPPPCTCYAPAMHLLCSKAHLVREADATQQPAGDGSSAQSHCEAQWLPTRQAHLQRLGVMRKECK